MRGVIGLLDMNPRLARWAYCACLGFLAAFAVIPPAPQASAPVQVATAEAAPETELARVVREKAELSVRYGARHPEMIKAAAAEAALREATQEDGQFRRALIRALSDELADAMRERREIAARAGAGDPELHVAQGVVLALTAAINREVRSAG
jgi:hypothetical protein